MDYNTIQKEEKLLKYTNNLAVSQALIFLGRSGISLMSRHSIVVIASCEEDIHNLLWIRSFHGVNNQGGFRDRSAVFRGELRHYTTSLILFLYFLDSFRFAQSDFLSHDGYGC